MTEQTNTAMPDFNRPFLPVINEALKTHADKDCLVFGDETYTYAEVDRLSAKVAQQLLEEGFKPGMKGAIYSLNAAISFITCVGLIRAGGIWIPINPRNSAQDNVAVLEQFGCDALFFQQAFGKPVEAFLQQAADPCLCVCLDNADTEYPQLTDWFADAAETAPKIERSPTDLITIPLTGGTTGLPKGVMLSNRNFCALEYGMRQSYEGRHPVLLAAAPMTHVGGRIALCGLNSGVKTVIMEKVEPQEILHTIEAYKVTEFFLPPTGIYSLLDQPNIADFDLSSLVSVSYGSAPMSIPRLKEALQVFGPVMRGGFGQTECPMFIARLLQMLASFTGRFCSPGYSAHL